MKDFYFYTLLLFFVFVSISAKAQDVMMQGWYWDYPKTSEGYNWADTLTLQAADLSQAGFTYIWLPPFCRSSSQPSNASNGYNPKDLYDLGEFGQGPTGFGTRAQLDAAINAFHNAGISTVADVIYNHRDGGKAENNPAVKGWIENMTYTKIQNGDQPFPSDRFRCVLPLGGATGNGAGDYYFKISSASQHPNFFNYGYRMYVQTNRVGYQALPALSEVEPNGGGNCAQLSNNISLGIDMNASIDTSGCTIDEFKLTLSAADFNAAGDTLFIYLGNTGGYSDHRIFGIWSDARSQDIVGELQYQTYTDFSNLPSGQGAMNYMNFKPNGNPTQLNGDWDFMYFFYDYDQNYGDTQNKLYDWTTWLLNNVSLDGLRMDAVKHFPPSFVSGLVNHLNTQGINPPMIVGEFYDGNANLLNDWVNSVYSGLTPAAAAANKVRIFDFELFFTFENICDNGGDARNLFTSGIVNRVGGSPFNVVTFVNNHDFRDGYQPVYNSLLAYVYILTNNQIGLPCVFYPDYHGTDIPNFSAISHKAAIDELMSIHQNYIAGANEIAYLNAIGSSYTSSFINGLANRTAIYQLSGTASGRDVVVALNFANTPLQVDQQVNTTTMNLTPGDTLVDLLGNSAYPYAIVNSSGQIYIDLPADSYSVWVHSIPPITPQNPSSQTVCLGSPIPTLSVANQAGATFRWYTSPANGTLLQSGASNFTPTNITASGIYTYYVEAVNADGLPSPSRTPVTLTVQPAIATSPVLGNPSCTGGVNGTISLNTTGGTGSYTYIWSNGNTTSSLTNLAAGMYSVTVNSGICTVAENYTLTAPSNVSCSVLYVPLKLYLQGAVVGTQMRNDLRTENELPAAQPFGILPWNYNGTESAILPANTADWILVEARRAIDNTLVEQRAALLLQDGSVRDVDGSLGVRFSTLLNGASYTISVRARNHLAVVSSQTFTPNSVSLIDFTQPANVQGGAAVLATSSAGYALAAGDFNADGVMDSDDFVYYHTQSSYLNKYFRADCTMEGIVTIADFNWLQANMGKATATALQY